MYNRLNAAMAKRGFARELPGKKTSYHLPTGTYWFEGDVSPADLRATAALAAEATDQDFGIAVIRANGWSVMGLKKVESASQA